MGPKRVSLGRYLSTPVNSAQTPSNRTQMCQKTPYRPRAGRNGPQRTIGGHLRATQRTLALRRLISSSLALMSFLSWPFLWEDFLPVGRPASSSSRPWIASFRASTSGTMACWVGFEAGRCRTGQYGPKRARIGQIGTREGKVTTNDP